MSLSKPAKVIYNYITARPRLLNIIKPISAKYVELAGYRKVGLLYEDLLREESATVQTALKRLPPRLAYDRAFRLRRALQVRTRWRYLEIMTRTIGACALTTAT
ncbi:Cytochrome b-c1 complex subunit 7 [Orbilia ellipsospora]|uniref:Complex III subunit 7 n=1 Tax=Orbilia ellipsospora TaxID=2528407 RepID=A0AAV9WTJ4_9PEZI